MQKPDLAQRVQPWAPWQSTPELHLGPRLPGVQTPTPSLPEEATFTALASVAGPDATGASGPGANVPAVAGAAGAGANVPAPAPAPQR